MITEIRLPPKTATPYAMVLDDEEAICRFFTQALAKLGVESSTYQESGPAFVALVQRPPDILFLDVALKRSNAIDVMHCLAERRYTGTIQLMSGGSLELLNAVQCIGAHEGLVLPPPLQKPFRAEAIRDAIASAGLGV